MVRNHQLFNRKFNRTGTRARTRPGQARPGHRCGPQRRWRRKWSETFDSSIGPLVGPGHVPELGQDRPAQDTDVATAALEAKMVRNHRFFNKKFNGTGTRARPRPGQARRGGGPGEGGRRSKGAKRDSQESVWTWSCY